MDVRGPKTSDGSAVNTKADTRVPRFLTLRQRWQGSLKQEADLQLAETAEPQIENTRIEVNVKVATDLIRHDTQNVADLEKVTDMGHTIALNNHLRSQTIHPLLSDLRMLDKWVPSLMQYWTTILLPEKFYFDSRRVPLTRMRYAASVHAEMADAMSHPAHMYAMLAYISIQMWVREGRMILASSNPSQAQRPEADGSRIPVLFEMHAMSAIRRELAMGHISHALANDVRCLTAAASHAERIGPQQPHQAAMFKLIASLGGLSSMNPYFTELMFILHWSECLRHLSRPQFPPTFDPMPPPPGISLILNHLRLSATDRLTTSFRPLVSVGVLSHDLFEQITSTVDVLRFTRWSESQSTYTPSHATWVALRHTGIGYHLLSLAFEGGLALNTSLNEAVRIATIFCVALTRSPCSGRRCAGMAVRKLRDVLEQDPDVEQDLWQLWTTTLLWVCLVGGMTAADGSETAEWFRGMTEKCYKKLGKSDLPFVTNVMEGFLWDAELMGERLLAFWLGDVTAPRSIQGYKLSGTVEVVV